VTQIFLLADGTSNVRFLPDPGNWNPYNKVECVGAGGMGGAGINNVIAAGGGGGAGYAVGLNLNLTFPVPYYVARGNVAATGQTATNFNLNSTQSPASAVPNSVSAQSGDTGGSQGTGTSAAGTKVFPDGAPGGPGGASSTVAGGDGGGGGGAGGPHGAGAAGGSAASGKFGVGGAADGGTTPGQTTGGGNGLDGTQWDATHGCGSGAAGSPTGQTPGGKGGRFGGGGGGGSRNAGVGNVGGYAGDGLIILNWVPFPSSRVRGTIMA
jgi:hypothetical protein